MMETKVVVLSSGQTIHAKAISIKILEQFDRTHKDPTPPMRTAEAIGGVLEQVADVDDPEYQAALAANRQRSTDDFTSLIFGWGVTDIPLPEDQKWIAKLRKIGIEVDPDELEVAYLQYVLMEDWVTDLKNITAAILRLSGITEESIAEWTGLF